MYIQNTTIGKYHVNPSLTNGVNRPGHHSSVSTNMSHSFELPSHVAVGDDESRLVSKPNSDWPVVDRRANHSKSAKWSRDETRGRKVGGGRGGGGLSGRSVAGVGGGSGRGFEASCRHGSESREWASSLKGIEASVSRSNAEHLSKVNLPTPFPVLLFFPRPLYVLLCRLSHARALISTYYYYCYFYYYSLLRTICNRYRAQCL